MGSLRMRSALVAGSFVAGLACSLLGRTLPTAGVPQPAPASGQATLVGAEASVAPTSEPIDVEITLDESRAATSVTFTPGVATS